MPNVRLYGDHAEPNKLKSDRTGAGTIAFKVKIEGKPLLTTGSFFNALFKTHSSKRQYMQFLQRGNVCSIP